VRSLFFVIILVGLIVGEWLYCPLFTRSYAIPLADIMDAAEAVTAGNLGVQVQEQGSREFQRLAHSFNRMTAELARTDQQRRNLTADVAHELRTPLHIIQGNLEGILGRGLCTDARAY
jgi:signal transduction histidine kinase